MNPTFKFNADDPDGRSSVLSALTAQLEGLPRDKAFVVSVTPETRSLRQNSYLWGVVYAEIVDYMKHEHQCEYSAEAVHEVLKIKFLPHTVEQMHRRSVKIYRTTTKLTKEEFSDYLEKVFAWAAEFGLVISSPDWDWQQHVKKPELST